MFFTLDSFEALLDDCAAKGDIAPLVDLLTALAPYVERFTPTNDTTTSVAEHLLFAGVNRLNAINARLAGNVDYALQQEAQCEVRLNRLYHALC